MAYKIVDGKPVKDNSKPFAWRAAPPFKDGERKKLVIAKNENGTIVTNWKNAQKKGYTEAREPKKEELIFKRR